MILYHGARKTRFNKIMADGLIKCVIDRESKDKGDLVLPNGRKVKTATTDGFVYLTNSPIMAVVFAAANAYKADENKIGLFQIELDDKLLLPDKDQLDMEAARRNCIFPDEMTLEGSLRECYCASYPYDINLMHSKTKYVIMASTLYGEDITRQQAERTNWIKQVTSNFYDGIGMLEAHPDFLPAMEYLKSLNWTEIHS